MKKTVYTISFIALFLVAVFNLVLAVEKKATPKQDASVERLMEKQIVEQGLTTIRSREWTIYLFPSGQSYGKKLPMQVDVLTFIDGKVASKNLTAAGYGDSNYTPSLMDKDVVVWETMQTNDGGDLVFWRGELRGNVMVGVLSMHPKKGGVTEYSFTSNQPVSVPAAGKKK